MVRTAFSSTTIKAGHPQIEAMHTDLDPAIPNRSLDLALEGDVAPNELDAHRLTVDGLEKAWPECAMDLDGDPDDLVGELFVLEDHRRTVPLALELSLDETGGNHSRFSSE